jgi:hypothetical protein
MRGGARGAACAFGGQGVALHPPRKLLKKVSLEPSKPFINFLAKVVAVLF